MDFMIWIFALMGLSFGVTACARIDKLEKRLAKLENEIVQKPSE